MRARKKSTVEPKTKTTVKTKKTPKGVSPDKVKGRSKKHKKKANLLKLYAEMNKYVVDAVDKEVVKRFRILIETSADEITKASLSQVLSRYHDVNISSYHESIQPYIKHYIYMVKREESR